MSTAEARFQQPDQTIASNPAPRNTNKIPESESPTSTPEQIHALMGMDGGNAHRSRRSRSALIGLAAYQAGGHVHDGLDDVGHLGHIQSDHVLMANAHPHQSHSVGYMVEQGNHPQKTRYENHGFEAVHIAHHVRDKNPEHHPPTGLIDHDVQNLDPTTQSIF